MSRLTPTAGLLVAMLFLAAGAWWVANMALLAGSGFVGASAVSTQAAFALVLGQWILIGLFAYEKADSLSTAVVVALSWVVPLWPLLALLWLTSDLSITTLAATQLIALVIAAAMLLFGRGIERLRIHTELRVSLHSLVGIVVSVVIWTGRSQLHAWVTA